jgi:hypothetical protein
MVWGKYRDPDGGEQIDRNRLNIVTRYSPRRQELAAR